MSRRSNSDTSITPILGRLMRQFREEQGISLEDMASQTGYSRGYISPAESGSGKISQELVKGYEKVFKMKEGELEDLARKEAREQQTQAPVQTNIGSRTSGHKGLSVLDSLSTVTIYNKVSRAQDRVLIMDTWLSPDIELLEGAFATVASKGIPIRIALLNPKSDIAKQRGADLNQGAPVTISDDLIKNNIETLLKWQEKMPSLELRIHNLLPSIQLYFVDNEATIGFYLHRMQSNQGPQLEVPYYEKDGQVSIIGFHLLNEFEYIWKNATVEVAKVVETAEIAALSP